MKETGIKSGNRNNGLVHIITWIEKTQVIEERGHIEHLTRKSIERHNERTNTRKGN